MGAGSEVESLRNREYEANERGQGSRRGKCGITAEFERDGVSNDNNRQRGFRKEQETKI